MRVRVPKDYNSLTPAAQKRIDEYMRDVAMQTVERDGRIMLDLYMKMICVTMHDMFGWGEKRLTLLHGHHRQLFFEQRDKVKNGDQIDYLNGRMAEIFKKNGFPQGFFDKMLGAVEDVEMRNEK